MHRGSQTVLRGRAKQAGRARVRLGGDWEVSNDKKNVSYLVLRLNDSMTVNNLGVEQKVKIVGDGVVGCCPVYGNIKDAEKASSNGKYKIYAVETIK